MQTGVRMGKYYRVVLVLLCIHFYFMDNENYLPQMDVLALLLYAIFDTFAFE